MPEKYERKVDGNAFKLDFKMFMEGRKCPFKSAMVSCTPNGVECNIVMNPTDKIFDLKPKTFIQIFYQDWTGPYTQRAWRLMGEGYFSGFSKNDDAAGARNVSIVCRDFRMDIRKTPAAMVYMPDKYLTRSNLFNAAGIKQQMIIYNKKGNPKAEDVSRRSYGGRLNNFYQMLNKIAGVATGNLNSAKNLSWKGGRWGDGRYFLDAFVRGLWIESVAGTNYGTFINSRARVDKRFFVPENEAGYTFFNKDFLNSFGGSTVSANSTFSSVEAAMMRVAAIFQATPYSCSTPTLIDAKDAMSDRVYNFIVKGKTGKNFGPPYVMNSCMIIPPMNFTAPPNCNIFFPCMYSKINWNHDYDSDITRGYFKHIHAFGNSSPGGDFGTGSSEVPNSLFDKNTQGYNNPPITIEERFKGVNVKYGSVEWLVASRNRSKSWAEKAIKDYGSYAKQLEALKSERQKEIKRRYAVLKKLPIADDAALKQAEKETLKKFNDEKAKIRTKKTVRPTVDDVMDRHAILKFINSRYASRSISVECDFNPYPVCGFPGIIMADDQRDQFKTLRSMIGMIQIVKHTIDAERGQAATSLIMSNVRFVSEATDLDAMGQLLYTNDTVPSKARTKDGVAEYEDDKYTPPLGRPIKKITNVTRKKGSLYDWNVEDYKEGAPKWAKDILLISKEGKQKGKTNLSFMDDIYTPNKIMNFYEKIFRQKAMKHFMVKPYIDTDLNEDRHFIFDSIHEAVDNLQSNKGLMNDYEKAIEYIKRDVVTEEQYFFGILGASYKDRVDVGVPGEESEFDDQYLTKTKRHEFDNSANRSEYFGVSTIATEDLPDKLDMTEGQFSSIMEKKPLTAFSRERRVAVDQYIDEVTKNVNSNR